jgi:hypothetical protein
MTYSKANFRNNGEKNVSLFQTIPNCNRTDKIFRMQSLLLVSFEYILFSLTCLASMNSVVGIATGYGLDDRGVGVQVPVGSRIVSSPRFPNRLWGPPNLLSNGYQGLFPRGRAAGS